MNELIRVGNSSISVKEYKGKRVVTFKDIDTVHERPSGTANKRFLDNKKRFINGEDYFIVGNSEIRKSHLMSLSDNDFTDKVLITESGYLMLVKSFTDDLAWTVQRKLVDSYFRVKQAVNEELSPELQLLQGIIDQMKRKEFEDKERDRQIALTKETLSKVTNTTERIKDALVSPFENCREDINKKVRQVAQASKIPHQELFTCMYNDLERVGRCDLSTRQRNKRERMERAGCTKTDIQKETTKIAVIEDDARLKQIFEDIVRKYGAKYIA